jgi:hypothetical protein
MTLQADIAFSLHLLEQMQQSYDKKKDQVLLLYPTSGDALIHDRFRAQPRSLRNITSNTFV